MNLLLTDVIIVCVVFDVSWVLRLWCWLGFTVIFAVIVQEGRNGREGLNVAKSYCVTCEKHATTVEVYKF